MIKVTDEQLNVLCKVLGDVLDDQEEVRDAWDVVSEFRSKLEYYDMIAQKQCTAEEYKLAKDGEYSTQKH